MDYSYRTRDPFLDRWWNPFPTSRIFDQNFGDGIDPEDFFFPSNFFDFPRNRRRLLTRFPPPPWSKGNMGDKGFSEIRSDRNKFQVILDVAQFQPEELNVKTVDNYLVVEGKHEDRQDQHGLISRQFTRKYHLPDDITPEELTCDLSNDGVMLISAPRKPQPLNQNERLIPIIQTGQPLAKKEEKKPETKPSTSK